MTDRTLLAGALGRDSRSARYGDFVIVTMSACAFATTALEFQRVRNWACARMSMGNAQRDLTAFTDRLETLLARHGSGIATKGSRQTLALILKGMAQGGIELGQWSIPPNVHESVEIKRKPTAGA